MWIIFFILGFFQIIQGQNIELSDEELIQSQANVEVPKIRPLNRKYTDEYEKKYQKYFNQQPEHPVPSLKLEPPVKFYAQSINDFSTEETSTISNFHQDSSTPISFNSSTIKTLRIYEITSFNSSSSGFQTDNDKHSNREFLNVSETGGVVANGFRDSIHSGDSSADGDGNNENYGGGFHDDFDRNKNIGGGFRDDYSSTPVTRINNIIRQNATRGNRKYQGEVDNDDGKISSKNNWGLKVNDDEWRRPVQRTNHFRFHDLSRKSGAIPGVPGQDYPINQEHIHHLLRNSPGRFPCPSRLKTHFYLADRASRCQIFYVCYGTSDTGVPMVCPNGTLFSQHLQVCDWWFNVIC